MSPTNPLRIALMLAMMTALAACEGPGSGANDEPPAAAEESEQAQPDMEANTNDEAEDMNANGADRLSLEEAVDAALQDLAERSGITPETISVVQAREVTWRDGAVGCPEEGMMYTQALVPGYYILLSDGQSQYAYHAGNDGQPFHCPAKRSQPPLEPDQGNPSM